MNFDIDLEIENAKQRFMEWLDEKVAQERFKMNFWYYFNNLGLIFTDSKDYIPMGKPVIFGTGGGFSEDDNIRFKKIWTNPEKEVEKFWSVPDKYSGLEGYKYIMGVDPID